VETIHFEIALPEELAGALDGFEGSESHEPTPDLSRRLNLDPLSLTADIVTIVVGAGQLAATAATIAKRLKDRYDRLPTQPELVKVPVLGVSRDGELMIGRAVSEEELAKAIVYITRTNNVER